MQIQKLNGRQFSFGGLKEIKLFKFKNDYELLAKRTYTFGQTYFQLKV